MKYIAEWEKDKEKTWSGTTLSLLNSLEKHTMVQEISLNKPTIIKKIDYALKNFLVSKTISLNMNFNIEYLHAQEREVINSKNFNNKSENMILQMGDIAAIPGSSIYQDLSIGSLLHMKKIQPQAFEYSGFKEIADKKLNQRYKLQMVRYENAEHILTMSKWLRNYLVEVEGLPSSKVFHVGGGINLKNPDDNIKYEKDENEPYKILFVGRDFYRKGGDLVVEAFKLLRKKTNLEVELYVAGPSQLDKKYLGENIIFLGDLNTEKLTKYFEECDIFCMPSRFEAYGLVFIEALVYGMPCIARDCFEMREFIEDGYNGALINSDNIEELSFKMHELLLDSQIKKNVESQKERYVTEYSWNAVAERIIKISNH